MRHIYFFILVFILVLIHYFIPFIHPPTYLLSVARLTTRVNSQNDAFEAQTAALEEQAEVIRRHVEQLAQGDSEIRLLQRRLRDAQVRW